MSTLAHGRRARFFLGVGPNTVLRISVNVIWESTHSPGDESPGGVGTFPNYLNGHVPPIRVVSTCLLLPLSHLHKYTR